MIKRLLSLGLLVACCGTVPASPDDEFPQLSDRFIQGYLAWRPETAVSLGMHEFDGKTTDFSRKSIDAEFERLSRFCSLLQLDPMKHTPASLQQRRVLLAAIHGELQSFNVMKAYTKNPMTYAGAFDLTVYAKRDFAPKAQRLKSTVEILNQVPATLDQGRKNLDEHLPRTYITTAIEQANGAAEFFTDDLVKAFEDVKDDALQKQFAEARTTAAAAMKSFAEWLKTEKLPKSDDNFAIGRDNYAKMLRDTELLVQTPEETLEIATKELKREQERFAEAARQIDPNRPPLEVYKSIQRDHPTADSLIPDTKKHLEDIRDFVVRHQLVSFPTDIPPRVEETPKFDRATSFASMDSPGPFETKATEAFYYVTPAEPEWDEKRKEEWLTAFNYYATDVTSIHEAYPGHYVQAQHLKASSASKIDKIFGSYAFIEGWAHYCEQMVIDEGFPDNADPITKAKYRLEQSDEALLRLCRLCCSVKMHCQGMSVEEATKFFMENCYFEEAPARAEAERGTYDPGYGFYTLGKLQILKLREDYRKQEGSNFSLQNFHDELLNHGQPPIRILREILLDDPEQWDAAL